MVRGHFASRYADIGAGGYPRLKLATTRDRATACPVTQFPRNHRDRGTIGRCLCSRQRLLLRLDMSLDLSQTLAASRR